MMAMPVEIIIYGADQLCASCVNLPSSKDTYEWLQAAIGRKYGNQGITYSYIDIFSPPEEDKHQEFAKRVLNDDFFYPVVVMNDDVIGEGNIKLKDIYRILENRGFQATS